MATDDGIENEKAALNDEFQQLIKEEAKAVIALYARLDAEGKLPPPILDGPSPQEVIDLENEYKRKVEDVLRRYRELVQGKKS